ncbi:adhesion G-protein coupled receptor G6 [Callorhinchus milii]|uniref:adhesion G-protein coupled receptor G6 n=1 Tax=Callorhinchus milii TaxID=7868 RepID=UPI001C3F8D9E|nr:adhesion G-protein coupled receptor G6 [Callorhinchus milii]
MCVFAVCINHTVFGCSNCIRTFTSPTGQFTSPCYPDLYPNDLKCEWTIRAPMGFSVQLTFQDFTLEEAQGCIYDSVIISTGADTIKLCGITASGLTLSSTGSSLNVSFRTDFSIQKKGFTASYTQVAVSLRNQKVVLSRDSTDQTMSVSSSLIIPELRQFTLCLEAKSSDTKKHWILFSYSDTQGSEVFSFKKNNNAYKLIISDEECDVSYLWKKHFSHKAITGEWRQICLAWDGITGNIITQSQATQQVNLCRGSRDKFIPGNGRLILAPNGDPSNYIFSGEIYNFRLWNFSMDTQALEDVTCDQVGNVVDWQNAHWNRSAADVQPDSELSCASSLVTQPVTTPTSCSPTGSVCQGGLFYRADFTVYSLYSENMDKAQIEEVISTWLSESFRNWNYTVSVVSVRIQEKARSLKLGKRSLLDTSAGFDCRAILYCNVTKIFQLQERVVQERLVNASGGLGHNLSVVSIIVNPVDNCTEEESPSDYFWPQTRPPATQFLMCVSNGGQFAVRQCVLNLQNYSSHWNPPDLSNCSLSTTANPNISDIENIKVSPDNAADVANQLLDFTADTKNLTREQVDRLVETLSQIVIVASINESLASTVVTVLSNILSSSDTALVTSSRVALQTVDALTVKMTFLGPSVSITSRNLALGISAVDPRNYSGTSFSVGSLEPDSDLKVDFDKDTEAESLAEVLLPTSLLEQLSEAEFSAVSRTQFAFFSKSGLFQDPGAFPLEGYVVASSVGNITIEDLSQPIRIKIKHRQSEISFKPQCTFWDLALNNGSGGWNPKGCRVHPQSNANETICLCDHLTHFGVLMDISGTAHQIDAVNTQILTFITHIGCGVSAIFSATTLLTYVAFEKLRRDYPSKILMNLSTSLFFLNLLFLVDGWLASFQLRGLCVAVGALLHFFLLASFTWMGLEAVHMYIALVKVFNTYIRKYMLKFCIVGWGLPALVVGIVLAINLEFYGMQVYGKDDNGQGASAFCWIDHPIVFYVTCMCYFVVLFLMNVAMFVVVLIQICGRNGKKSNRSLREEILRNLRSVVSLTFLLGLTWGFAFFAWGPVNLAFMYLFAIFNSLQGFFVFVFHCALKENVQKQWRRYLCCGRFRLPENSDWSRTVTNNTKKVSSENLGKSLSSSSIGSNSTGWASKLKSSSNLFKTSSNKGDHFVTSPSNKFERPGVPQEPAHNVLDKVKGYCSAHSDNFYKNIMMSDAFSHSTKF